MIMLHCIARKFILFDDGWDIGALLPLNLVWHRICRIIHFLVHMQKPQQFFVCFLVLCEVR